MSAPETREAPARHAAAPASCLIASQRQLCWPHVFLSPRTAIALLPALAPLALLCAWLPNSWVFLCAATRGQVGLEHWGSCLPRHTQSQLTPEQAALSSSVLRALPYRQLSAVWLAIAPILYMWEPKPKEVSGLSKTTQH